MENKIRLALGAVVALGIAAGLTPLLQHLSGASPDFAAAQSPRSGMGMMHHMQLSSEFDYLTQMIPHHQEAIDTAQIILTRSSRPEMKQFAQNIIRVQSSEITQMKGWLKEWYPGQATGASYQPMMRDLSQLRGDALDRIFLQDMIKHHMEAVMMSQVLLSRNFVKHRPVELFAEKIATAQRQEIDQMKTWLMTWFGSSHPMDGMHH